MVSGGEVLEEPVPGGFGATSLDEREGFRERLASGGGVVWRAELFIGPRPAVERPS
jgi:hypothetical protein